MFLASALPSGLRGGTPLGGGSVAWRALSARAEASPYRTIKTCCRELKPVAAPQTFWLARRIAYS